MIVNIREDLRDTERIPCFKRGTACTDKDAFIRTLSQEDMGMEFIKEDNTDTNEGAVTIRLKTGEIVDVYSIDTDVE